MAYDKNTDYQSLIDEAVKKGDYASASRYEQSRNEKIDKEGLSYEKTNNYTIPLGVDDSTYNKMMNRDFTSSQKVKDADTKADTAFLNLGLEVSNKDIVSSKTKKEINKKFKVPSAVLEADAYLADQLKKIQSGKTSYSDQVKEMMDKIMNREKFSYDVDTDPLFQQALASATNSGKQAMQDTIGQASALTGGYGSSYATSAGNQAYNSFIEDAYDNLPQYYQMAMEAYQMEGDEMYRQFGMVSELDDKEFNRNVTAYDATYQHRNQLYNEAYAQFRDSKSDAFATANLEISEHGQKVSDLYNYYNAANMQADKLYEREYNEWADSINMAYQYAGMLNSNAWETKKYDENVRQYEKTFAENVRQYDTTLAENKRQYDATLAEQKRQHDDQMAYNYKALAQSGSGGGGSRGGSGGSGGSSTQNPLDGLNWVEKAALGARTASFQSSLLTRSEFKKRGNYASFDGKKRKFDTYEQYVEAKIDDAYNNGKGIITEMEAAYLYSKEW